MKGSRFTRFIVLTTQRTGSTWFIDTLHGHEQVVARSELLIGNIGARHPKWGGDKEALLWEAHRRENCRLWPWLKSAQLLSYLERVAFARSEEQQRAAGFKLMYDHLRNHRETMLYLLARRVAVIHLVRNNLLDIILSEEAVKLRQVRHAHAAVPEVQVTLNCAQLIGRLREKEQQVERARRLCRRLRLRCLEVVYEDLVRDPAQFQIVLAFLGADAHLPMPGSALSKLNRRPHHELIANFGEVRQTLAPTRYARYLEQALQH